MSLSVDVIVRTLADPPRSKLLFRALDSIQDQGGVRARPVVIVNGQKFDVATLEALKKRPGILLHQERQASAGQAMVAGRNLVMAPFFSYLDDDDELIEGSLLEPLRWFDGHPQCDVLINNGFFVKAGGAMSESTHLAIHVGDPAMGLLKECWLSPGACLFRTVSVPGNMLRPEWDHLEWTHLAFELCAERKRLHFMDVATVRYFDTPGSLSKQMKHHEAALDLLLHVKRDGRLDLAVRRQADRKYLRALHNLAATYWRHGRYLQAWYRHLGSLRPPQTLEYLLFTRKLLWPFGGRDG